MKNTKLVWEYLLTIPRGRVTTYGSLGKIFHLHSRTVGQILHHNSNPNIPCYKVVNSLGKLSQSYVFGGITKQKEKLNTEGIIVKGDKINLKKYFWKKT